MEELTAEQEGRKIDYRYIVHVEMDRKVYTGAVAAEKLLLYNYPCEYEHGRWPGLFLVGLMPPGDSMGTGDVEHMVTGSEVVNTVVSMQLDNLARTNNTTKVLDITAIHPKFRQGAVKTLNTPGGVMVSLPGRAREAVAVIQQTPIDASGMYLVDWVLRTFDEISNHPDIQSGKMNYQTSGKGIGKLLSAADTALSTHKDAIESLTKSFGIMVLYLIHQYWTIEDKIRVSSNYRDMVLGIELYTPPGEETRMVMTRKDNTQPQNPMPDGTQIEGADPNPRIIVDDLEALQFDVEMGVRSDMDRDPAEKRDTAMAYYKEGLATGEWAALQGEIPGPVFREAQEEIGLRETKAALDAAGKDEVLGAFVQGVLNPETAPQVKQMIMQGQAALQHLQRRDAGPPPMV